MGDRLEVTSTSERIANDDLQYQDLAAKKA